MIQENLGTLGTQNLKSCGISFIRCLFEQISKRQFFFHLTFIFYFYAFLDLRKAWQINPLFLAGLLNKLRRLKKTQMQSSRALAMFYQFSQYIYTFHVFLPTCATHSFVIDRHCIPTGCGGGSGGEEGGPGQHGGRLRLPGEGRDPRRG